MAFRYNNAPSREALTAVLVAGFRDLTVDNVHHLESLANISHHLVQIGRLNDMSGIMSKRQFRVYMEGPNVVVSSRVAASGDEMWYAIQGYSLRLALSVISLVFFSFEAAHSRHASICPPITSQLGIVSSRQSSLRRRQTVTRPRANDHPSVYYLTQIQGASLRPVNRTRVLSQMWSPPPSRLRVNGYYDKFNGGAPMYWHRSQRLSGECMRTQRIMQIWSTSTARELKRCTRFGD